MKILFLPAYFYPEDVASSFLGKNTKERYAKEGWNMELCVSTPSRGISDDLRIEYKKKKTEIMYNGKLIVHRFPMFKEGRNPILRAFRYFLCGIFQLYYSLFTSKNIDVIFIASTPPIQGMLGGIIKKWRKIPFVYNLQDIFPDSLVNSGLAKKGGLLWKIGRVIEDFTYRHADKIIVISQDFKKNIMAKGVPEEKIEVVYNWVDENAVVDVPREDNDLFDKYDIDRNKFILTYSGNIGLSQNIDMLLEVMKELQRENPDIHLVLVGEGAYRKKAEEIVEKEGLKNVSMLPFQPYDDISKVFSLGDVGLVISKPGTGNASVPSKTWSIMSASRPVLANFDENELKDIIATNGCGIFTKAGDKEGFKQAVSDLFNDRSLCGEMGKNGRSFILKNLTREIGTSKYVNIINNLQK